MKTSVKRNSKLIYLVFFIYVCIITVACTFAQTNDLNAQLFHKSNAEKEELKIYPNPSTNYCNISLPEAFDYANMKIEIYNLSGAVGCSYACYSISDRGFIIDLTNFPNGAYVVHVTNGCRMYKQKMVVLK